MKNGDAAWDAATTAIVVVVFLVLFTYFLPVSGVTPWPVYVVALGAIWIGAFAAARRWYESR